MRISLITTVKNEEGTIVSFLNSIKQQKKIPDEIVIVDGGSRDETVRMITKWINSQQLNFKTRWTILTKKGNRSVGRNYAIRQAKGEIILCSDAGCILDKEWVRTIALPFHDKQVDVVSGYYSAKAQTLFQKCLVPYVLVMEDKLNSQDFLPSSRSMAFRKKIWQKFGGFPEQYSHNEDYVFANRLKAKHANIVFAKGAIAYWIPRRTFKEAFIMFYRFALGDAEARLFRKKVMFVYARYFIVFVLLAIALATKSLFIISVILLGFVGYTIWAIMKNYRYIRHPLAGFYLPLLQYTADCAVLLGTTAGILKSRLNK